MRKVIIEIDEVGDFTADLQGFHGKGCKALMDEIGGGAKPTFSTTKREFHEQEQAAREVQSGR